MKNKLEVEITRDGREVTAKCIHLNEEYIGKGDLINNGVYFISSDSEIEIRDCFNTLFVWGQYTIEEDSVAECLFSTEQEAIEYVENITKLIDEFNDEEVKSTPRVVIPEEMLSQDEIDDAIESLDEVVEIKLGIEKEYVLNKGIKLKILQKDYGWVLEFYRKDSYIGTLGIKNKKYLAFSMEEINEILKPYNAKIITPRKTVKIKSIDGVEFEVYLDELEVR